VLTASSVRVEHRQIDICTSGI